MWCKHTCCTNTHNNLVKISFKKIAVLYLLIENYYEIWKGNFNTEVCPTLITTLSNSSTKLQFILFNNKLWIFLFLDWYDILCSDFLIIGNWVLVDLYVGVAFLGNFPDFNHVLNFFSNTFKWKFIVLQKFKKFL